MGVEVLTLSEDPAQRARAERFVAQSVGIPLSDARLLLAQLPTILPRRREPLAPDEEIVTTLEEHGATARRLDDLPGLASCDDHPFLLAPLSCDTCSARICRLCAHAAPVPTCSRCRSKRSRSRSFFYVRVTILLGILASVLAYAYADLRSREQRVDWKRSVSVAVVLVEREPVDTAASEQLAPRLQALEEQLHQEMRVYRKGDVPFRFSLFGPVRGTSPPSPPTGEDLVDMATYSYDLWRYTSELDERAQLDSDIFDSRIYLVATPPRYSDVQMVEGLSQQGGRIGVVEIELAEGTVDLALFVLTHELFHTLGAHDKYDASGAILVPDGLADPSLDPLYPQRGAEVMARHRATSPHGSEPPETLDELVVGEQTAREIGWLD